MKNADPLVLWNPVDVEDGRCVAWHAGALSLWVQRHRHEWHTLSRMDRTSSRVGFVARAAKPTSDDWRHYLLRDSSVLEPLPVMPDRPIVLRPDRALILFPGEWAQFFVALPLWFRLRAVGAETGKAQRQVLESATAILSGAWFGEPDNGELCYFATSRLFSDMAGLPPSAVDAVCPLRISNESDTELSFDRICLHTEFLSIYRSVGRLLTNGVAVVFRGSESSQVVPSKTPPDFDGPVRLLSGPRKPAETSYFRRTFSVLKLVTGF